MDVRSGGVAPDVGQPNPNRADRNGRFAGDALAVHLPVCERFWFVGPFASGAAVLHWSRTLFSQGDLPLGSERPEVTSTLRRPSEVSD